MSISPRTSLCLVLALCTALPSGTATSAGNVSAQREPLSLGILVEASDKIGPILSMAHDGVNFLLQTLHPEDEVFVMAFGRTSSDVIDFTQDKAAVSRAFGRFLARGTATLNTTLDAGLKKLNDQAKNKRKVLLIITTGIQDSDMGRSRGMVGKDDVMVHALGLIRNCGLCERGLQDLVKLTNGTYVGLTSVQGGQYTIAPAINTLAEILSKP
jgi:hypothetical protein